jgi:uncharacterized protein YvpB
VVAWVVGLLVAALLGQAQEEHVLRVPYRSQLDGSAYQAANCGPTALAMVLGYYGVDAAPGDLRVRAMQAQHSWIDDDGGYRDWYGVFVYNLASVAEAYGLHADGLWLREGNKIDRLREWTAADVRREINAGRPVIVEVRYRALPRNVSTRVDDDHYIVVHGLRGQDFVYSDPLGRDGVGPEETISEHGLLRAMAEAETPSVGFALVAPN